MSLKNSEKVKEVQKKFSKNFARKKTRMLTIIALNFVREKLLQTNIESTTGEATKLTTNEGRITEHIKAVLIQMLSKKKLQAQASENYLSPSLNDRWDLLILIEISIMNHVGNLKKQ